eukprot:CAMPEP_0183339192 /NCGR_PEP_ID=MMETSP0164_2-20130417/6202_1 /TAXON_ID=221442 /ORGANISM="Coccolithus pelagicus ssp braarudi, Strain PLY182g" /LENGTH=62 /DNA_ID=CAMNT_0025509147 /DNA_START=167 /DNA_END=354 /DNA_ORIENTATION=-
MAARTSDAMEAPGGDTGGESSRAGGDGGRDGGDTGGRIHSVERRVASGDVDRFALRQEVGTE